MSAAREFAVTPPDMRVPGLLFAFVLLTCLVALAFGWRELQGSPALWLAIAVCLGTPALIVVALFRRKVTFDGASLRIVAGLNQARVPASALLANEARIVDLDTSKDDRLGIKSFGTSMPGYHAGHFKQIGGHRVFALVTDKHRVLVLPEQNGRRLMLSLQKPQALLDALQRPALTK